MNQTSRHACFIRSDSPQLSAVRARGLLFRRFWHVGIVILQWGAPTPRSFYWQETPGLRQANGSSGGSRPPSRRTLLPSASGRRTATRVGGLPWQS